MRCPGSKPPWAPAEEQAPDEGEAAAGSPPVSAAARAEPAGERSAAEPRPSAGSPESVGPREPAERWASGAQRASTDRKVSAKRPRVRDGDWGATRGGGRG